MLVSQQLVLGKAMELGISAIIGCSQHQKTIRWVMIYWSLIVAGGSHNKVSSLTFIKVDTFHGLRCRLEKPSSGILYMFFLQETYQIFWLA